MEEQRSPCRAWAHGECGGSPQILSLTLTPCPVPACTAQPCPPAEVGVLPVGPFGGAGVQWGLFLLLLCRASTEAWSRERLSLRALLASLSQSSSISMGSLYSFPDPWYGAMVQLAGLKRSAPSRSPKAVRGVGGGAEARPWPGPPTAASVGDRTRAGPRGWGGQGTEPHRCEAAP